MTEFDSTPRSRREMLGLIGGVGATLLLAACDGEGSSTTATTRRTVTSGAGASTTSTPAAAAVTSCSRIPEETAGPYPGDGTNGPNVLTQNGVVRSDIRSSIGSSSTVATGVPLTIALTLVDLANGCRARSGAAIYLWHCDASGGYSMYSPGVTAENYLRGVQVADANGTVTFQSIFPAAYSGRWPHIHFEMFPALTSATNGANRSAVSQLALPAEVCQAVYATTGYAQSASNLSRTPIDRDNVFSDGYANQLATMTGNVTSGYTARLVVAY